MRYLLAGGLVFVGATIIGLAYHNTLKEAWGVLSQ